jgi:hypothetical protein
MFLKNTAAGRLRGKMSELPWGPPPHRGRQALIYGIKIEPEAHQPLAEISLIRKKLWTKSHGRQRYGEMMKTAKLKEAEVFKILKNKSATNKALAEQYHVSQTTISEIKSGKKWKRTYNQFMKESNNRPKLKRMPDKPAIARSKPKPQRTNKTII